MFKLSFFIFVFLATTQRCFANFICDSEKPTRRFLDDELEVQTVFVPYSNFTNTSLPTNGRKSLQLVDIPDTPSFCGINCIGFHCMNGDLAPQASHIQLGGSYISAGATLSLSPMIFQIQIPQVVSFTSQARELIYKKIIKRIGKLFGISVTYENIIERLEMLKEYNDVDLRVSVEIMNDLEPFTPDGFVMYVRRMIKQNDEERLPFIIRLSQKLFDLTPMPYEDFKTNFIAIINNLTFVKNGKQFLRFKCNLLRLPIQFIKNSITLQLRTLMPCLNVFTDMIEFLTTVRLNLIPKIQNLFGITIELNPLRLVQKLYKCITVKVDALKTIVNFLIEFKINKMSQFLEHITNIFKAGNEVGKAFLTILGYLLGIPDKYIHNNTEFTTIITDTLQGRKTGPTQKSTSTPAPVATTTTTQKPLTKEEKMQLYLKIFIKFLQKILQPDYKSDDKFLIRLRTLFQLNVDDVSDIITKLYHKFPKQFTVLLESLGRTIEIKNPDYELLLKKFRNDFVNDETVRFITIELAKSNPKNTQISNVVEFLNAFIENIFDSNYKPYDTFFVSLNEVFKDEKVNLTKLSMKLQELLKKGDLELNMILSILLTKDNYYDYDLFESKLQSLFLSKGPLAEYILQLPVRIFKLNIDVKVTLKTVVDKTLNSPKHTKTEVAAMNNLTITIKMIFCQNVASTNPLITNLYHLFMKDSNIDFNDALQNLYQLFMHQDEELNMLLTYIGSLQTNDLEGELSNLITGEFNSKITKVFITLLTRIFKKKTINIKVTIDRLKFGIVNNVLDVLTQEIEARQAETNAVIEKLMKPNSPGSAYFTKALNILEKVFNIKISEQTIRVQITKMIKNNDQDFAYFRQWYSQLRADNLNIGMVLSLKTVSEMYAKKDVNLRVIGAFVQKALNLTKKLSFEEFYKIFLSAVSSINVISEKTKHGYHITISFILTTYQEFSSNESSGNEEYVDFKESKIVSKKNEAKESYQTIFYGGSSANGKLKVEAHLNGSIKTSKSVQEKDSARLKGSTKVTSDEVKN